MTRPAVGILTFHRCINYGSYWQARALADGLAARGYAPVVVDHCSARVNVRELRCALEPTLPTPVTAGDRRRYAVKARRLLAASDALPLTPRVPLECPEVWPEFDTIVVGSDEVWNLQHPFYGGYRAFFGDGLPTRRLVAHSASVGNYAPERSRLDPEWSARLGRFDAISVRDDYSRQLVAASTGAEPPLVLDPCLQFAPAPAESQADAGEVVVYGHNFTEFFAMAVRRWAGAQNRRIVSVGYRNDWADEQRIEATPDEFASAITHACAVATNFFHGCVFALRFERPFVCEANGYRFNKVKALAGALGTQHRMVFAGAADGAIDYALSNPIEPDILAAITEARRASDTYLDAALAA
jgi:hypothetical protein